MKKFLLATMFVALSAPFVVAQDDDVDVDFGFDPADPTVVTTEGADAATNSDGFGIAFSEFENLGSDLFAEDPGFFSDQTSTGDEVFVTVLNAGNSNFGTGFVNFFDPDTKSFLPDVNFQIDNSQESSSVVFSGDTVISGNESIFLGTGAVGDGTEDFEGQELFEGEVHNHLIFDLLESGTPADDEGVFGFLLQIDTDLADANGNVDGVIDASSNPFFVLINNGASDAQFAEALVAFGVTSVPEPSTGLVLAVFGGAAVTRRRRRL